MKKTTKIMLTGAASLLGVALATGGAFAATGSLDAPGQALKISGIAPAASHVSANALTHANAHAKGLFGVPATQATSTADTTGTSSTDTTDATDTTDGTDTTTTVMPVAPSIASKNASTVKGRLTGEEISAWAHQHASAEAGTPDADVSLEATAQEDASAKH